MIIAKDAVIKSQHRTEEHLQALVGAVAKPCQELPVVFEIDAQHDRDAEGELSMGDSVEDVVVIVFPEQGLAVFFSRTLRSSSSGIYAAIPIPHFADSSRVGSAKCREILQPRSGSTLGFTDPSRM